MHPDSTLPIRRRRGAAAGLFALAAAASLLAGPAGAAERYLALGLPFFDPYRAAIATIDVHGGKVEGTLAAPVGDPRPAIPLSGSLKDGILRLTVGSGAEAAELAFSEDEKGLHQVWWETAAVPGLDEVILFRPTSGFSEAALVLQRGTDETCGKVYGGLSVALKAADLKGAAAAPAALADLDVPLGVHGGGATQAKLKDIWSRLRLAARDPDNETISFDIAVPLGAEARIAQDLRREPLVASVTLPAECGETALATVPRAAVSEGAAVFDARLKSYIDALLPRLYSGAPPEGRNPGTRKFKIANAAVADAGGLPAFTATITAESEASRLAKGNWDQFTLTVRPVVTASDTGDTISLVPAVTAVKTARKGGGQMPADSAFATQEDPALKAALAQRFVSWVAAAEGSRCTFLTQTAFDEPEDSLSCANITLDDPTVEVDN